MTRVLFVLGTTAFGGAENQCRYLLGALRQRGLDLELVCFRPGAAHAQFEALDIPVKVVPARTRLTLDWYRRASELRHLVGEHPPDILNCWMYEAQQVGLVASKRWRKTEVVLSHRSGALLPGDRKHIAALRLQRRRIGHVVANSEAGARMIVDLLGLDPRRVSVIPNGIPAQRIRISSDRDAVRRTLRIEPDAPVICSVGRVDHQRAKDYPTLLVAMREIWSALPEAELILVGPTRPELERELGGKLPARVHALGWQPSPADFMNAADVIAIHSRTEGHSNVADEALMLGLPVATTSTGGHQTLVRRSGGKIIPVGQGALLGGALLELVRRPPQRAAIAKLAQEALSIDHVASAYLEIYDRLLGLKPSNKVLWA